VDGEGFLVHAQQHIDVGTLAATLVLTLRARISSVEFPGTLGDGRLDVEVFVHRDTDRERSLGSLVGNYGAGSADWQDFELDVSVRDLRWPVDPGPGHRLTPAANEFTLVFTGIAFPVLAEVDWLMLEPKDAAGLAWRPVSMQTVTVWPDAVSVRTSSSVPGASSATKRLSL